ncbi:MAG: hypothetical protein KDK45_06250, partial [Leptospiraceae bacterium]|nr:hypothetical protein [Leptospiraceae bacterium]
KRDLPPAISITLLDDRVIHGNQLLFLGNHVEISSGSFSIKIQDYMVSEIIANENADITVKMKNGNTLNARRIFLTENYIEITGPDVKKNFPPGSISKINGYRN